MEKAEDVEAVKAVAPLEEVELDGEGEARDVAAELLNEFHGGFHGAAGGEQVVDEDDALAALHGVEMDLEGVGAILEVIADAGDGSGELARLADGDEAGIEPVSERGAEGTATGVADASLEVGESPTALTAFTVK